MMLYARLAVGLVMTLAAGEGAPIAAQADSTGAWTMSYTTKEGVKLESTLTVQADGGKLTGTISSPRGSVALSEIRVTRDDVAFAIVRVGFGDTIRIDYTGKVEGGAMKLKMKVGAREALDVVAVRQPGANPPGL